MHAIVPGPHCIPIMDALIKQLILHYASLHHSHGFRRDETERERKGAIDREREKARERQREREKDRERGREIESER